MNKIAPLFIIGAQRSYSTSLCRWLDSHSKIEILKPIRPEPKTFIRQPNIGFREYSERFTLRDGLIGEKSTSYFEKHDLVARVDYFHSDVKVLAILRNPIDRAISNYNFSRENGLEKRGI